MSLFNIKKDSCFKCIATACGLGLSPIAPGTCGALLGVALHGAIVLALPDAWQLQALLVVFLGTCAATVFLTPWAEAYWKEEDPKHFVTDEVAGYLFVIFLFREGVFWKTALWAFVLFRVLDIFKFLPPARLVDRSLHGPWGILLDDLVSAAYAAFIMYFIYWIGPSFLFGPA